MSFILLRTLRPMNTGVDRKWFVKDSFQPLQKPVFCPARALQIKGLANICSKDWNIFLEPAHYAMGSFQ